jgi:hypothetical protein
VKTVSITFEDRAWDHAERLARARGLSVDGLICWVVSGLADGTISTVPDYQERRRALDPLWAKIDVCGMEIDERPSRDRTYDDRRFHRH